MITYFYTPDGRCIGADTYPPSQQEAAQEANANLLSSTWGVQVSYLTSPIYKPLDQVKVEGGELVDLPPDLSNMQESLKKEVDILRNYKINEPLIYDGKVLDADEAARDNLKAKLEEVRERIRLNMPMAPELLVWRDNANQTHSWPTIEAYHDWLAGYAVEMSDRGTRCYACAWYHKDAIGQLSTVEAVMDYNITHGWPA